MLDRIQDGIRLLISGGKNGRKRPTKETMLIIFLSGILIFVILLPTGSSSNQYFAKKQQKSTEKVDKTDRVSSNGGGGESTGTMEEYRRGLEQELEEFLSSVAGVGEVKVLIYMKNSQEYIVEKEIGRASCRERV